MKTNRGETLKELLACPGQPCGILRVCACPGKTLTKTCACQHSQPAGARAQSHSRTLVFSFTPYLWNAVVSPHYYPYCRCSEAVGATHGRLVARSARIAVDRPSTVTLAAHAQFAEGLNFSAFHLTSIGAWGVYIKNDGREKVNQLQSVINPRRACMTDGQTYNLRTKYCNPRCACAPRVNQHPSMCI